MDSLECRRRFVAVTHENGTLHDIGPFVLAHEAQAGRRADRHVGDVTHADGRPVLFGDDDVLDVVHVA